MPSTDTTGATLSATGVPPGFHAVHAGGPFINANGPLYFRREGGVVSLGLRVEKRHCNPMNHLHGGMMASFCDMLLPLSAYRVNEQAEPRFLLTVSLQIDYVAGAPLGCWLEGSAEMLRRTRTLVFMRGLVTADGTPCARVSGISRIGPPFPKGSDEFSDLAPR
jgi:uncharacterized protein (TIGR00369 family)